MTAWVFQTLEKGSYKLTVSVLSRVGEYVNPDTVLPTTSSKPFGPKDGTNCAAPSIEVPSLL